MKPGETKKFPLRKFAWLGAFAAAMGMLEAIVVVYLRELYYPDGFHFPLQPLPPRILLTEMLREVCTIVMLVAVAATLADRFYLRLSFFLFTFGIWDIFYYVGLKALLNWPPALTTWDILFLIPVTWAGPVLAPLISSITVIALSIILAHLQIRYVVVKTGFLIWTLLGLGVFAEFLTYVWDYSKIIIEGGFLLDILGLQKNPEFQKIILSYVPEHFNWYLFALGETLILSGTILLYRKTSDKVRGSSLHG